MRDTGPALVLLLACASAGCGYSPRDKSALPLKSSSVQFAGLAPKAGDINLLALNHETGGFDVFASVKTNGNTFLDRDGMVWYEYSKTLTLPQDDKYWQLGCCTEWPPWYITLKTRMGSVDFYAFDTDSSDACLSANYQSMGGIELGETCATRWYGDKKTVRIEVPIGGNGQQCGDPNWLKGNCFSGLFCGQDLLCHDTDLYCPSGQIARYDGACEVKNWPTSSDIQYVRNHPSDDERNWTNDIQGIASSGTYWFVSNTTRICRFSARSLGRDCPKWDPNLRNSASAFPSSIRSDLHLSNMDFYGNRLYVGAYRDGNSASQVVTVVDTSMGNPTYAYVDTGEAFLAVHPITGDLYTITNASPRQLGVYRREYSASTNSLVLTKKRMVRLINADGSAFSGNRFQGSKFSPSGKLYIVFDDNNPSKGGVFVFNVAPTIGRLILRKGIDYEGGGYSCFGFPAGDREQELEDILIEHVGDTSSKYFGDLHLMLLNNDCDTDNYWLKHYSVTSGKL